MQKEFKKFSQYSFRDLIWMGLDQALSCLIRSTLLEAHNFVGDFMFSDI